MKKKILFISFYFPPLGGGGVQRITKFIKYLNRDKYIIDVLTIKPFRIKDVKDYTLLKDIDDYINIIRLPYIDLRYLFMLFNILHLNNIIKYIKDYILIPDESVVFAIMNKKRIERIISKIDPDMIIITLPPFGISKIASNIKMKFNKIKIIIDMRDMWIDNYDWLNKKLSKNILIRHKNIEKKLFENADFVIIINDIMKRIFENKYINKYSVIDNGYDEDDFYQCGNKLRNNHSNMEIVYSGSFYGIRNPINFFNAIYSLIEQRSINIKVNIYGKNYIKEIIKRKYRKFVKFHGYSKHTKCIKEIVNADLLLLYVGGGGKGKHINTGKIYEYIRAGVPILLIGPNEGIAAEIIRKSKTGYICDDELYKIKQMLKKIYELWERKELSIRPNTKYIKQFDRRNLTLKLEKIIDKL